MIIQTKDLWQSAFMLANGSNLEDVKVRADLHGRKEAIFVIGGGDTGNLIHEFRTGQAVCNVARLRASMIHLKEEMYRVLRS